MRTNFSFNPMSRSDLDRTSGKNSLVKEELVNPVYYKIAKSVIETNSKVCKPKTYNKIINNLIYGNKWCGAVDQKL